MSGLRKGEIALVVVSIVIGYVILEAGFRFYLYLTAPGDMVVAIAGQMPEAGAEADFDSSWYIFDLQSGWRYPASREGSKGHPWFSHWRSNSHGHISDEEYPVERPQGEFRICVMGDSFTANVTNNVRWTAILEDGLNTSRAWTANVRGAYTRVLNFGIDGQGVEQMAKVAEFQALPFGCSIMMVNFISDNILRRLHYAGYSAHASEEEKRLSVEDYVREKYLSGVDWLTLRPELLVAVVGRWVGLEGTLPSKFTVPNLINAERRFERPEGVAVAARSFTRINDISTSGLLLLNPVHEELAGINMEMWDGLVEEVVIANPALNIVDVSHYLDLPETLAALDKWFYIPHDKHYSDYGVERYGAAVLRYLTGDFLNPGEDLGATAIISADTVRAGAIGRKRVSEVASAARTPRLPVRVLVPESDLGPLLGSWSRPYETYVEVANAVTSTGSPLAPAMAAILGRGDVIEDGVAYAKIYVAVPAFASADTEIVVGLFLNGERFASAYAQASIAGGETGTVTLEQIIATHGGEALGVEVRIGVRGGGVFLNGDEKEIRDIGEPQLIIEHYADK